LMQPLAGRLQRTWQPSQPTLARMQSPPGMAVRDQENARDDSVQHAGSGV